MAGHSNTIPETIGHYKIIRELGRGAMGTVYLARQDSLDRDLALKVLNSEFTRDREFVARFKREGLISARLRHPNIVQVFDYSDKDGVYYIAMEYVGALDLQKYLRDRDGKLSLSESVRLSAQVLSALECAHERGITHRDVKPANVLMNPEHDAVLTDFSIASMQEAQRLTVTGAMVGTPDYMAPEQFDAKNVDKRSDLYAVGIMCYEMLTGRRPFQGDAVSQVMKAQLMNRPQPPIELEPAIPEALSAVLMRALEKQPTARFDSAAEMRTAMLQAIGATTEEPLPPKRVGEGAGMGSAELPPTQQPVSHSPSAAAASAEPSAASRTMVKSGTVELLSEVGHDFRSTFLTPGWTRFSRKWLTPLLVVEFLLYVVTRPQLKLLPGPQAALSLVYPDLWLCSAALLNLLLLLLVTVRVIRGERAFRVITAGAACMIVWIIWGASFANQPPNYSFTKHLRAYASRVTSR